MKNVLELFRRDYIGNPPWDYYFLQNLDEKEYPRYLAKLFYLNTGEKLPLKNGVIDKKKLKTFNQKIQWLKLYDATPLKRDCTDKVKVRDYIRERIGEEYLKPVLQIIGNCSPSTSGRGRGEGIPLAENDVSTYFDQINWEKLPNAFVIKTNHGCKWQYIIKNKEEFLKNKPLFDTVKRNITGWLEQEYWCWGGFEMQYKGIEPKILIEPLMRDEKNTEPIKINVYCFNGAPKILISFFNKNKMSIWNENFEPMENIFNFEEENVKSKVDDCINQTFVLSAKLCTDKVRLAKDEMNACDSNVNDSLERKFQDKQLYKDFIFVRIDWMLYNNRIYFEELTFAPYSGLIKFDKKWNKKIGSWINLKGDSHGF